MLVPGEKQQRKLAFASALSLALVGRFVPLHVLESPGIYLFWELDGSVDRVIVGCLVPKLRNSSGRSAPAAVPLSSRVVSLLSVVYI